MPALNVRDFPADLMAKLKKDAEAAGVTLREHCINKLAIEHVLSNLPLTTASQLPQPALEEGDHPGQTAKRCGRCQAPTIPWGPGARRCRTCAINWPA